MHLAALLLIWLCAVAVHADEASCIEECNIAYESCRNNCKGADVGLAMAKVCRDIFYKCLMDCTK